MGLPTSPDFDYLRFPFVDTERHPVLLDWFPRDFPASLLLHRNLKRGCRAAFESDKLPGRMTDAADDLDSVVKVFFSSFANVYRLKIIEVSRKFWLFIATFGIPGTDFTGFECNSLKHNPFMPSVALQTIVHMDY